MSLKKSITKEELETFYTELELKGILKIEVQNGNVKIYDNNLLFKWLIDKIGQLEARIANLETKAITPTEK